MATLKDVAERAGVSASIVSYVLNGKKSVRPETLKRIEEAIEELDYRPNLLASSLKTSYSRTIGVVVSDMSNLFFIDILTGIQEELRKNNYCGIFCNSDNSAELEKEYLKQLSSRNIDGLLLIGTGENEYGGLEKLKIPVIGIDRKMNGAFPMVCADNELGGFKATEYLLKKGHRRILYLGVRGYSFSEERYQGYLRAMRAAGREEETQKYLLASWKKESTYQEVETMFLEKRMEGFDAVFCGNDYIAVEVMKVLVKHGVHIPKQMAVMGYDNIALAKYMIPELTTVAQPKGEMGQIAARKLLNMICHKKEETKDRILEPFLVERESC